MNWPIFDSTTAVLIQGMTGKEGSRMASWMITSGTLVLAGVTPGKAGQIVLDRPIFSNVADARAAFPEISVSCIVVPAQHVLMAAREALEAGITFVYILSEHVPVHDVRMLRSEARAKGGIILGPSSVGMLQFPRFRLGYIGGEDPFQKIQEGHLALISASGGMANELLMAYAREGIGVRIAIAVGGDRCPGTTIEEAIGVCVGRDDVSAIGLFVEPGNPVLQECITHGTDLFQGKRVALFVPGDGMERMPRGIPYGHAGTMLGEEDVPLHDTRARIREQGIPCFSSMIEFLQVCKTL